MPHKTPRANVLFIMADQWRGDWLGADGADFLRTPNLDRLASRGMLLRRCYTNCPVCAPARIGLASGLQPLNPGALNNHAFLPKNTPTYYQHLRNHGYRVGCVGKLDLAKPDEFNGYRGDRPCTYQWGFTDPEECEGKMHAGRSTPEHILGPYGVFLNERGLLQKFHDDYAARSAAGWIAGASHDSVLPTDAFEDVYIGRRAVQWLRDQPGDFPWHYFVSFAGPHNPFDPPAEYADRWRDVEMPPAIPADHLDDKPAWVRQRARGISEQESITARRQYAAAIECIDDMVGEILDALADRGELDNTYIVFSSDHGEMLGDFGLWTKTYPYEPSTHVPLIVAGPGIPAGRTSDALTELNDLNPTICEMAGVGAMADIEARSFLPLLRGEANSHRDCVVSAMHNWRMIRTDRYKAVIDYGSNGATELYDLSEDPQELRNIASEQPELARDLAGRCVQRYLETRWHR
ncbi:MAG: sulfatase family protein [Phycisphaerae bacterium]